MTALDTQAAVRDRYADAAKQREPELCCPVDYDATYLKAIPQEVIDRDYGCGDPSKYVREDEVVLDLGSGSGKICFIASQVVGPGGRVIGVDMNDDMLALAIRSRDAVTQNIGYDNVEFRKGKIQDLAIDRDAVESHLQQYPVTDDASLQALESFLVDMRANDPMIAGDSIDVVVSNCVLNLVDESEKAILFDELFRVLRPGGRAVISDIVADTEVPTSMRQDAKLWSGCISGAYQQTAFLEAFENAGFEDITIAVLQSEPWQVVNDIAFRSMTVIAHKPEIKIDDEPPISVDTGVRRIYRGPFKYVGDDSGAVFTRGEVCDGELAIAASRPSLADHFSVVHDGGEIAATPSPGGLPMADADCCSGDSCC
ncbi:MAG: methyltransferase domain-containing protein [Planctomycetota bacterium]